MAMYHIRVLVRLDEIDPGDATVGSKAAGLARMIRAGLAVPPGFVVPATTTRMDEDLARALVEATAGRGPWVVRSSSTVEDSAPGIFRSRRDVASADVPRAVEEVWTSRSSETARAYLAGRAAPMAVIVQQQVDGALGAARTRMGGGVLVESGEQLIAAGDIAAAAERIDELFGAAVDVEWVAGDRLWIVQARRAPPAAPREELGADEVAFSRDEPETLWSWDATHNPAPLSPAQAGLVELVEEAGVASLRQRVVRGYLYTSPGPHGAPPADAIIPADRLVRAFTDEIAPAFEAELARMGDDLEATLAAYLRFYRLYARRLAPSLARAPAVRLPRVELELADVAPAWDVAAPSYRERSIDPGARLTRLADVDDVYFARAQAGVRRALLAAGARLGLSGDDVFFLPLAEVRRGAPVSSPAAAREELARRSRFAPPLAIRAGIGIYRPPSAGLRGRGTGGRARGLVLRIDGLSPAAATRGKVLVAAAILPTMAPLLEGALAIVAEHGGLLGHGASLARELGLPCVVGCAGALTALRDGDEVWVDADEGVVLRLGKD
jgi:pyruvate,water dikinase